MKKLLLIIVFLLSISLFACESSKTPGTPDDPGTPVDPPHTDPVDETLFDNSELNVYISQSGSSSNSISGLESQFTATVFSSDKCGKNNE